MTIDSEIEDPFKLIGQLLISVSEATVKACKRLSELENISSIKPSRFKSATEILLDN